jgi:hypothetical protein
MSSFWIDRPENGGLPQAKGAAVLFVSALFFSAPNRRIFPHMTGFLSEPVK